MRVCCFLSKSSIKALASIYCFGHKLECVFVIFETAHYDHSGRRAAAAHLSSPSYRRIFSVSLSIAQVARRRLGRIYFRGLSILADSEACPSSSSYLRLGPDNRNESFFMARLRGAKKQ